MISDASPLIYLGKINRLQLLRKIYGEITVPKAVEKELFRGATNAPEIPVLEKAIGDGWIKALEGKREKLDLGLHPGEEEVLGLALEHGEKEILIDETQGRAIAKAFGLKPRGTIFVLLKGLNKNLLDLQEYESSLRDLAENGFYLSQDVYLEVLRLGKEVDRKNQ